MLLEKDKSGFLLVDVQEKLLPHILNSDALLNRCLWILRLAKDLTIPIVVSEQYPSGLGQTVEALRAEVTADQCVEKVDFSCYSEPNFVVHWQALSKSQVVIAGIETHVCVLQTAIEMQNAGFEVFVVVDAVQSRHDIDNKYGLKRMKQLGIQLVTAEMVFFEWVGRAGTHEFKILSQSYLRGQ